VKQDPITFNVTTENIARSRAVSVSTTENLNKFVLYANYTASTDGATAVAYIDGDTLKKESGKWGVVGGDRYWPAAGTLDFYAVANNGENTFDLSKKTITHTVNSEVAKQTDLLYAVTLKQSKPQNTSTSGVNLYFRHALSQILFRAKCLNEHLKVTISGVKLVNVKGTGVMTLPESSTADNYNSTTNSYDAPNPVGKWDVSGTTGYSSYELTVDSLSLAGKSDVDISKKEDSDKKELEDNYMLLIPQATTKWDMQKITDSTTGSYLALKCKIENYVDDNTTSVQLWPTSGTDPAYVYIPVAFEWKAGYIYTYTFIFGSTTNGGYDGDGKSVLTPITFSVSVNGFTTDAKDVEMEEVVTE
jgi:hypothetical protein